MKERIINLAHKHELNPDQLVAFASEYANEFGTSNHNDLEKATIDSLKAKDLISKFKYDNRKGHDWRENLVSKNLSEDIKAQFVLENINFRREGTPHEKMNIGNKEVQTINRLDNLAKKYGFRKSSFDPEDKEEGIINIKKWVHPEMEVDDEIQVSLYKAEDGDILEIFFTTYYGGSGNDSVEQWLDEETWKYYYGEGGKGKEDPDFDDDKEYY